MIEESLLSPWSLPSVLHSQPFSHRRHISLHELGYGTVQALTTAGTICANNFFAATRYGTA